MSLVPLVGSALGSLLGGFLSDYLIRQLSQKFDRKRRTSSHDTATVANEGSSGESSAGVKYALMTQDSGEAFTASSTAENDSTLSPSELSTGE